MRERHRRPKTVDGLRAAARLRGAHLLGVRKHAGPGHYRCLSAQPAGPLFDRASCRVKLNGELLALTATEFRLLDFMMTRRGVVFSREQLLDAVWGHDRAVTDRTVDVYILRLRQKTETDPTNPTLIRSVRGFGYSFNEADAAERTSAHEAVIS